MAPLSVAKHLDVLEQVGPGVTRVCYCNPDDAFALETIDIVGNGFGFMINPET